ncbi:LOW QUALITY PROTEIN: hypothetical protein EUGRSUZ_D00208 [Eucalyptus grandis]|nr:LOW QUALITY PROTEIN: hypothetical protein EUGRSUZ_D00208 [Eucalyptus grandis]
MRDQDMMFANQDPNIAATIGSYGGRDITFSSQGPYWRNLCKLFVRQMMSNASLEACCGLRRQEVKKALSDLYKKSGVPVDIGESAVLILINVIMAMLYCSGEGRLSERKAKLWVRSFERWWLNSWCSPNISDFVRAPAWLNLQGVERDMKRVHKWFDDFIQSAMDCATEGRTNELLKRKDGEPKSNEQKKDFLQIFLDMEMDLEDNQSPMDKNGALKAIFIDIVVGGTDTTSTTVEWVMAELLRNLDVMNKVVQELTEEAFRLHPVLPIFVPWTPHASCVVGGYTIPEGSYTL